MCTLTSFTLNASIVGTLISTAGKLCHVRIAEGKYESWWHCILENGILNVWSWPLVHVVLVVAGVRYICEGMDIRWWAILYIITIYVLVLLCYKIGHFISFNTAFS
jgi:small-conductance mechanosensitive channel